MAEDVSQEDCPCKAMKGDEVDGNDDLCVPVYRATVGSRPKIITKLLPLM